MNEKQIKQIKARFLRLEILAANIKNISTLILELAEIKQKQNKPKIVIKFGKASFGLPIEFYDPLVEKLEEHLQKQLAETECEYATISLPFDQIEL